MIGLLTQIRLIFKENSLQISEPFVWERGTNHKPQTSPDLTADFPRHNIASEDSIGGNKNSMTRRVSITKSY